MTNRSQPLFTQQEGARELVRVMQTGLPYAAGKLGTSEFDALRWYIVHRRNKSAVIEYPYHIRRHMVVNAGLFPDGPDTLDKWAEHMLCNVLPEMDLMIEWNPGVKHQEYTFLETYAPHSKRTVLRALEPYYEESVYDRYTLAIPEGSKIAIISPFSDTLLEQIPKLHTIWSGLPVWGNGVTFIPIQTFYSPLVASSVKHQWTAHIHNWQAACDDIVEKVRAVGATYAFVGCGALSLPIVAALKRAGCIAIHTGGATQILFGIKGRRWDSHAVISRFYNSAWIRPVAHEIPDGGREIENGCYF